MNKERESHGEPGPMTVPCVPDGRVPGARPQFVLGLMEALRTLVDAAAIQAEVVRQLSEHLGVDRAYYGEVGADGQVIVARDHHAGNAPSAARRYPLDAFGRSSADALRAGRTLVLADVFAAESLSTAERQACLDSQIAALVEVPRMQAGRLVGVLAVHQPRPRNWQADEIALIEEVAGCTWAILDRAEADAALRRLNAELARRAQVLHSVLSSIPDFAYTLDRDGRFVFVNKALLDLWGLSLDQAVGKNFFDLQYPAALAAKLQRQIRHVIETREPVRDQTPYTSPGGVEGYYEYIFAPAYDGEGNVEAIAGSTREITARRRIELNTEILDAIGRDVALRSSPDEIMAAVGSRIAAALGVSGCVFVDVDDAGGTATVHHGWNAPGAPDLKQTFQLSAYLPTDDFVRASRAGEVLVVRDTADDARVDAAAYAALQIGAFVTVPFRRDGKWVAYLAVIDRQPRDWRPDEISVFREVTNRIFPRIERARAEAALRLSEERYRSLFDGIDEGFCVMEVVRDDAGRIMELVYREINSAFERLTGLCDVVGKSSRELFPSLEPYWLDGIARVMDTGVPLRMENWQADLGRWFSVQYSRIGGAGSRFAAVVFDDITERKRADDALRASEQRQGFLLLLSDAMREQADEQAIGEVCVRMLARHLRLDRCWITRLSREDGWARLGPEYRREDLASVHGDSGEVALSRFPGLVRQLETQTLTVADMAADRRFSGIDRASIAPMRMPAFIAAPMREGERNVTWALVAGSGEPREWTTEEVHLVENVAERTWALVERKRVEVALRKSGAELERANHAKDEFLAMLGHELRNPLAPITTTLQLMRLRAPDAFAKERGVIEGQVSYLTGLVDDLLDVARIARGKFELQLGRVDLREVVDAAIETTQPALEERRQVLHAHADDGLVVSGDRRRLVQVLVNLLGNAAKYSPPGRNIYLAAVADHGDAVIRVRDEGQGIAPALLPHVFESFTQDSQSIERARGGLGLGLAIVRNIVTFHGGSVSAASDGAYKGSEFVVRLPLLASGDAVAVDDGVQAARPAAAEDRGKRIKVLVVDDYALAAESLAMLLQEMGYHTRVARDGAEALQAIGEFKPQVALVDIGLPVIDGYEVAQTVRGMPGFEDVPLVAVTGYGQASDRERVMAAGFNEHLVKPLDAAKIGELIERLVATM